MKSLSLGDRNFMKMVSGGSLKVIKKMLDQEDATSDSNHIYDIVSCSSLAYGSSRTILS